MTTPPDAATTPLLEDKRRHLLEILRSLGSVCVGYSGGVDSAFLACIAVEALGPDRVLAVTGLSPSYPRVQREAARSIAARFGIPHLEIDTHEVENPAYAANSPNRCYFCKSELWSRLATVARERGLAAVVDGSNADDGSDHRPGMRAGAEHGVRSPLAEAGLTKGDVRALSRSLGLPTWDQPASPCLASRVVYGLSVTPARLRQIEGAEEELRALGLREFRVRHHGSVARIEVAPAELDRALAVAPSLDRRLRSLGFGRVLLDVEGYRRGSLNQGVQPVSVGAAG